MGRCDAGAVPAPGPDISNLQNSSMSCHCPYLARKETEAQRHCTICTGLHSLWAADTGLESRPPKPREPWVLEPTDREAAQPHPPEKAGARRTEVTAQSTTWGSLEEEKPPR